MLVILRPGGRLVFFRTGSENINLVEDVEFLLSVKFRHSVHQNVKS